MIKVFSPEASVNWIFPRDGGGGGKKGGKRELNSRMLRHRLTHVHRESPIKG